MTTIRKFLYILVILGLVGTISAKEIKSPPTQAFNICALAMPLMNLYAVNYEYLFQDHHGLDVRLEYIPLQDENTGITANGFSTTLDYRWHFSPKMESFFIGPYIRYRYLTGNGTSFDFVVSELNVGINAGYRWIHKPTGINVVLAAGYGYSWTNRNFSDSSSSVLSAYNSFAKANAGTVNFVEAPFLGEFSIGYAF